MSGWEYAIMRGDHAPIVAELNDMGAKGWELTTYVVTAAHLGSTNRHILTFKRPLPNPSNEGGARG